MNKEDSSHKRVLQSFCISKTNKFFVLFFKLGKEKSTKDCYLFIFPSKEIFIKLSSPLLLSHETIDPLTPAKKEGYDH